ncbi:MAG: hypothetical protein GWN07_32970, partial [Actinobacteria bacterium]|nr:hypothetical protein [Actinomycetota bacterium]NIS35588.1 hypothetical protein [Actinomycetota bacterium]NIU70246.1 hypothetical protein [Actinomycetota bacterium]NIV58387.1 hypothetical protein [Actinomycetota bacterium]NIV89927.1 hypothetical protein [Actinomycetota bacterium]
DGDNDTYAAGGAPMMAACSVAGREFVGGCAVGTTDRAPSAGNADCDDTSALVNPAGTETCNGLDDDCSG